MKSQIKVNTFILFFKLLTFDCKSPTNNLTELSDFTFNSIYVYYKYAKNSILILNQAILLISTINKTIFFSQ